MVHDQSSSDHTKDCKSLSAAAIICATLVNTHTDTQLLTSYTLLAQLGTAELVR